MKSPVIHTETLKFLKQLDANNNRDWFLRNKLAYDSAHENMIEFVSGLLESLNVHDKIATESPKRALYRIYADTRFHKGRAPYNARFAAGFAREKPYLRGGYTFSIRPGKSYVACGFFNPNAADLKRIRMDILADHAEWRKMLNNRRLKSTYGILGGSTVLTTPKGFPKDHVAIDLLRHKQFIFRRMYSDSEVTSHDFMKKLNDAFLSVRPFFDHMSQVLTTDMNGESLH